MQTKPKFEPRLLVALFSVFGAPGCFGVEASDFPPGLEPLEPSSVPRPPPEERHEAVYVVTGSGDLYDWGHGRGYIHLPLSRVWPALREPLVSVDRRNAGEYSYEVDTEPEYAYSYRIHTEVREFVVTVEFDVAWRHGVVEGTEDEPHVVAARWKKVFGTTAISLLEGSMLARELDENLTEIELVEHVEAVTGSQNEIRHYLQDYFASALAHARGEPLPTYDD